MQLRGVPANDDFATPQPLYAGLPTSAYGSNEFATRQAGEPEIAGNPGGASVWYSWTPSSSGDVPTSRLQLRSSHPLLGVYTGSAIDGLTEVDSADGNGAAECSSNGSKVRLHVTAGTMYRIAIDGRDGQQGSFELRVVQPATNDDFDQAEVLSSSLPASTYGSNTVPPSSPASPKSPAIRAALRSGTHGLRPVAVLPSSQPVSVSARTPCLASTRAQASPA